jgi:hypothetical protein
MTSDTASAASPASRGWGLTLRIAAILSLASIALFATQGASEESVRAWVRATARASVALFLMAFVARPLRQLWRSGVSSWLLANRRYLGASAAYAQLLHLFAIVWLYQAFPSPERTLELVTALGGGLAFAFYFAMGLSSNDAAVAALGKRNWKRLHTAGGYWIWFVFAQTNLGNVVYALSGKLGRGHQLLYVAIQLALFGAIALRIAAWRKGRLARAA